MPINKPYYKCSPMNITSNLSNTIYPPYFTIKEMANIYGFPAPNTAISSVVGVVSFGGGLFGVPAKQATPYVLPTNAVNCDILKYWQFLGYTPAQLPKIIVYPMGGAVNDLTDLNSTGENTLDISVICGCCPNPNVTIILFIFPYNYTFSQALPSVLAGVTVGGKAYKPTIVSISWGSSEVDYLPYYVNELDKTNSILKTATQNGVNICVAAGDNGSSDNNQTNPSGLSVDFPSSSPYVTAVGGTTLICPTGVYDDSTTETVWNDGLIKGKIVATGGGISTYFPKPIYQPTNITTNYRTVPDIALNSDPGSGLIMYFNGQLQAGWGGTSMAAPMFAGYLALLNPKVFVNPLLYSAPYKMNFHDITVGNNKSTTTNSYSATVNYDCCTGLGSINGANLKNVLVPASAVVPPPAAPPAPTPSPPKPVLASSISLNVSSVSVPLNKTFQLVGRISPSTAANKTIGWATSNPNVMVVNNSGVIIPRGRGTALARVSTTDGTNKYAYATVYITAGTNSTKVFGKMVNKKQLITKDVNINGVSINGVSINGVNSSVISRLAKYK